jgi:hypothetical protein
MADPYGHYPPGDYAQPYGQQQATQSAYGSQAPPSHHSAAPHSGPNYRWWIPGDGIRRDVIQADIQRYLGQDALVKPGVGTGENAVCTIDLPRVWIVC